MRLRDGFTGRVYRTRDVRLRDVRFSGRVYRTRDVRQSGGVPLPGGWGGVPLPTVRDLVAVHVAALQVNGKRPISRFERGKLDGQSEGGRTTGPEVEKSIRSCSMGIPSVPLFFAFFRPGLQVEGRATEGGRATDETGVGILHQSSVLIGHWNLRSGRI